QGRLDQELRRRRPRRQGRPGDRRQDQDGDADPDHLRRSVRLRERRLPGADRHPRLPDRVIADAAPTSTAPPTIDARDLTRRFGTFLAVDRVGLRIPAGSILALLGPNGAGKTTIVRMLAGLLAPTAGEAVVAGCDVRADPAGVRARVGLVTDVPGLHEQMAP